MADDYRRLGREAGRRLVQRIAGGGGRVSPPERHVLPAELRPGETTGPAPAA